MKNIGRCLFTTFTDNNFALLPLCSPHLHFTAIRSFITHFLFNENSFSGINWCLVRIPIFYPWRNTP